jgi:hypothetical protein
MKNEERKRSLGSEWSTVAGDRVVADGHGLPLLLDVADDPHHAAGNEPVARAQEKQEGEEDHATAEQRERRPVWKVETAFGQFRVLMVNELQKKKAYLAM